MPVQHIQINASLPRPGRLVAALRQIKQGLDNLNDEFKILELCKDGASFTQLAVDLYGFADTAGATDCFNEVSSLLSKLNTDASVSSVNAAILQAFRKMG